MKKVSFNSFKKIPWIALLCSLPIATPLWAAEVHQLGVKAEGDVLRLQIETDPGTLREASLTRDGSLIAVSLKEAKLEQIQSLVRDLQALPQQIQDISIRPTSSGDIQMLIQLREPSDVLDETIAASGNGRSVWELVLGRYARLRELVELEWRTEGQQRQLFLRGGPDLVVNASAVETPPALVLEFPSLTPEQLQKPLQSFKSDGATVTATRVEAMGATGSRLSLMLGQPLVLDKPRIQTNPESASILLSATPAPQVGPDGVDGVSLQAIRVGIRDGAPVIQIDGADNLQVDVSAQSQPAGLKLSLQGVSGKRAAELVAQFKSTNPQILGARVEQSGPRSSQVVVDLLSPLGHSPTVQQEASVASPGKSQFWISLSGKTAAVPSLPLAQGSSPAPAFAASSIAGAQPPAANRRVIAPVTLTGLQAEPPVNPDTEPRILNSVDLMGALDLALKADPKYLAAQQDFLAASEAIPQARAGYLPTATFDFQRNASSQTVEANATGIVTDRSYPMRNSVLTITQPIIRIPALIKMKQADVSVEQARAVLLATEQDQMIRLASTYMNMLAAQDGLELARAERQATEAQYQMAAIRARSGLVTSTQLYETEGRMALTQAKEIEAQNNLEIARLSFKEIIGSEVKQLKPFVADFDPAPPQPVAPEAWVRAALEQNLSLQVSSLSAEIAKLEVSRQTAGYAPSLNLVLNNGRMSQGDAFMAGQPSPGYAARSNDVSLRLSIPLFEGGMTNSLVRESTARLEKAQQDREAEALKTERLAKTALLSLMASSKSIPALRKSLMAQESSLETKLEGLKSGLYSNVQVVDAYRLMYSAKRDFLQARYDYLINRIKLKQSIGAFTRQDLQDLADLLK